MSELHRNVVGSPPPPLTDVRRGTFHLLAIGINRYRHWPRLATAVNGARDLARLLADDYGFGSITTLIDEQATRAAIIGELRRLVDILGFDDSLLVYFAGHGHLDRQTQTGAWIPVDALIEEEGRNYDAPASWLQNGTVRDYLRSCKARHILVVSDSCFAGDFLRGTRELPPTIDDAYVRQGFRLRSRQVLTAGGMQPVTDGGLPGHSVFTGFLLHTLRDHPEPWLLPAQVHARLRTSVAANANQQPLLGALHDTGNEPGGEFVFFRQGSGGIEAAIAARQQQLAELERARTEAEAARERFAAEIAAKKAEEQQLATRIAELQERLGTGNAGGGLDQLVGLVEQREREADELAQLEERARRDAARRAEELAQLEAEERRQQRAAFEASVAKFRRVRDSRATTPQLTGEAWRELCRMWQLEPAPVTPCDVVWDDQRHRPVLLATEPASTPPSSLSTSRAAAPNPQPTTSAARSRAGIALLLLVLSVLGWAGTVAVHKWQNDRESAQLAEQERREAEQRERERERAVAERKAIFENSYAEYQRVAPSSLPAEFKRHAWRELCRRVGLEDQSEAEPVELEWSGDQVVVALPRRLMDWSTTRPFVNSLGMKFVPVVTSIDGTEGVLFSIWETQVRDYEAYAAVEAGIDMAWKNPGFSQDRTHPVVRVSWEDAQRFCAWLTAKERAQGRIGQQQLYRLPTDAEWSWAVGIGEADEKRGKDRSLEEKAMNIGAGSHPLAYPWGKDWPPQTAAGNYDSGLGVDDYADTSPVGSFGANPKGLYDLGGNVWEWVDDYFDGKSGNRGLRGASFYSNGRDSLLSSYRYHHPADDRNGTFGFRVVLVGADVR